RLLVRDAAHDRGDRRLSRQLRCPAAPLPENEDKTSGWRCPDHDRLHDSVRADRIRQLLQRLIVEVLPRLIRVLVDLIERHLHNSPDVGILSAARSSRSELPAESKDPIFAAITTNLKGNSP